VAVLGGVTHEITMIDGDTHEITMIDGDTWMHMMHRMAKLIVKPVYKGHSREKLKKYPI
jgi:hypothetical protein